ncbi:DUF2026 family protein [Marinobacter xestospongiae]|uniref:DUF2026 family protein n=1 Tax=Marinobacter xestospongiae TaxID=994319 RepID=UPI002004A379|nr:DUF2026 family protein [Marinobacter xestospongiae]MCK7569158.1 DUF2026 domain-containing protein [Marinobacter xestospongiae]
MKRNITLKQYELIFRIVSAVGEEFAHGATRSCQFYNVTGAYILKEALKIDARPMMGAAFVKVNQEGDVFAYAGREDGEFFSSLDAFHCWIETDDFYIDFTAPEYCMETHRAAESIPRKMFQKPKTSMSTSPELLQAPGDFFFERNPELTAYLLQKMFSKAASGDLVQVCLDWYKQSRKKIVPELGIMDDRGEKTIVRLRKSTLCGVW